MTHKYLVFTAIALIMGIFTGQAQHPGHQKERREEIKALRVAFITERLDLSVEQAQTFWPVYNMYEKKLHQLHMQKHKQLKAFADENEQLRPDEMTQASEEYVQSYQQMADLRKEYHQALKKVLPAEKVFLLYQAEFDFQKELLHKIRRGRWHPEK